MPATLLPLELRSLDRQFAAFIARLAGAKAEQVALAAGLVSRELGEGHVCVELRRFAGRLWLDGERERQSPPLDAWIAALRGSPVVGTPGERKPLILDAAGRLYLHRYWTYEQRLAGAIARLAARPAEAMPPTTAQSAGHPARCGNAARPSSGDLVALDRPFTPALSPDGAKSAQGAGEGISTDATGWPGLGPADLNRFFPAPPEGETDWQRVAAETALRRRFCIITGGPGTGKTRTLAVILALLLERAVQRPPRVAVAAPTGKAAARIQEALRRARAELPCSDAVKALLPSEARTLHRLLGYLPDEARFRHHAENPLPFDFVAVDEASMVDLALMAKLFDALPPHGRVALLGDKDQLASVEAGAVLADICAGLAPTRQRPDPQAPAEDAEAGARRAAAGRNEGRWTPPVIELRRNYRFAAASAVGRLATAIRDGDTEAVFRVLAECARAPLEVGAKALPEAAGLKAGLAEPLLEGFGGFLRAREPTVALAALDEFRVLCALRESPFGVRRVNELAVAVFEEANLLRPRGAWYPGRPVMVTRNDYDLGLFNGDTGALLPHPATGELRAWFRDATGALRDFPPGRLPEHETAFALTVHKSQGSEFDRVLLLLPDRENPVLTRELLYTGLTRARARVELWMREPVFLAAIGRRVERGSGLRDALAAALAGDQGPAG